MNDETLETLSKIRNNLKQKHTNFPRKCCDLSSFEIFDTLGFNVFCGAWIEQKITRCIHYWNVSPDEEIIDLTARQFGDFPEIYILKQNSEEAQKHYRGGYPIRIASLNRLRLNYI